MKSNLKRLIGLAVIFLIASQACSWITTTEDTPPEATPIIQIQASPTEAISENPDLPPILVETQPMSQSELGNREPLTFYFSQPMETQSVESAIQFSPAITGSFIWVDDMTLSFIPEDALPSGETLTVIINTTARSAAGLEMQEAVELQYATPGSLVLADMQPQPGVVDVDPSSAIFVSFNRPVVELAAEGIVNDPPAFTLSPSAEGEGLWLNTSTYIFYPDPPLLGGVIYTVSLNSTLTSLSGSELALQEGQFTEWSFTTAPPRLVHYEPVEGEVIPLDAHFVLQFNQPMDSTSVESSFRLADENGTPIAGEFTWNEDFSSFIFQADDMLQRSTEYSLTLGSMAAAAGGTMLDTAFEIQYVTVSPMSLEDITPDPTPVLDIFSGGFGNFDLVFTSHLAEQNFMELITIEPEIGNAYIYLSGDRSVNVSGIYDPDTTYSLTISQEVVDRWGETLSEPYVMQFTTSESEPSLAITGIRYGAEIMFLTAGDRFFTAQVTNLSRLSVESTDLSMGEFIQLAHYDPSVPVPQMEADHSWTQTLSSSSNRNETVEVRLQQSGAPLEPGLYRYYLHSNELTQSGAYTPDPFLMVVSDIQISMKRSTNQLFIWAVDLQQNIPVADAEVNVYDIASNPLGTITTGPDGTGQIDLPQDLDPYTSLFAVTGQPGEEGFSLAIDSWYAGVSGSSFGYYVSYASSQPMAYLYTDRPIYQPGQEVNFRMIVRQAYNARYAMTDLDQVTVDIYGDYSMETGRQPLMTSQVVPLSSYGTGSVTFALPDDASPGYYSIYVEEIDSAFLNFKVAEYRKPEIDLQVQFAQEEYQAGDDLQAEVNASYFFGAPAGNLPVTWVLYSRSADFSLPYGYQTGSRDMYWAEEYMFPDLSLMGSYVTEGNAETLPDGSLILDIPYDMLEDLQGEKDVLELTLEVSIQDESGFLISNRDSLLLHPADFYIGLRPDAWNVQADDPIGYTVQTVDWQKSISPNRQLTAFFEKVVWETDESDYGGGFPEFIPTYTEISSSIFETDDNGQAYLMFTPEEPGTYVLRVEGEGAQTCLLLWVGGTGSAAWPSLPMNHITLTSDAAEYEMGQDAKIFVPNPFNGETLVLLTVERGEVMYSEVLSINATNFELTIPIEEIYAPNVFVAVTLLGQDVLGNPDYRQGYIELIVPPESVTLDVTLSPSSGQLSPGDEVVFAVQVNDSQGNPVEGEFSLALVDKAVLALANPNAEKIVDAFYGRQPLGVENNFSLAAYANLSYIERGEYGIGGGGDASMDVSLRDLFEDTAFWDPAILTDANGTAQVALNLPDNLTTWVATLRGLTQDTRVGEAEIEIVTSKELLLRPVTPRFLVAGDHVQVGAVVHNNTTESLTVDVSLLVTGAELDDGATAAQEVQISAGDASRVNWWLRVEDTDAVELIFKAESGELVDETTPQQGAIPVLRYTFPQTYGTSGILSEEGQYLEVISLPRTFTPSGGKFQVELSSSLSGTILSGLHAVETFSADITESVISRMLSNLTAFEILRSMNSTNTELLDQLSSSISDDLDRMERQQNYDGGWGWITGEESDAYVSSYALFAISRSMDAGFLADLQTVDQGIVYLQSSLMSPADISLPWQFDRLVFQHFALQEANVIDLGSEELFQYQDQLSAWGKSLLAYTLEQQTPGSPDSASLLADVQGATLSSATSSHWEDGIGEQVNCASPNFTTAIVVYVLSQLDPQSAILGNAVRYLVANQQGMGGYASSYENAWVYMALYANMLAGEEFDSTFTFEASLNQVLLARRESSQVMLSPVTLEVPLDDLLADAPNALEFQRDGGSGRLYYRSYLQVYQPVESVEPLQRGIVITRQYELMGDDCPERPCDPVHEVSLDELTSPLRVRLTVTVPEDTYYLVVEDTIPAGTEIVNEMLNTSQLGSGFEARYDPDNPFREGWNWWLFTDPQIYDEHIRWVGQFVAAGTYELTYRLQPLHGGEYQVIPAHAYQYYFPEAEGRSAGEIFTIVP